MNLRLTMAGEKDLPQIAELAHKIWNDHYPAIIGQQQVDYMLDKFYSQDSLKEQLANNQVFYMVEVDGQNTGFVSVSHAAMTEELFIHKFYVLTGQQRSGLGSLVLRELENMHRLVSEVRLTVNRQNHKSINFYFKNGFTIEKVADFDIGNHYVMNDFVMVKKLR